jgi:hypothetical protein
MPYVRVLPPKQDEANAVIKVMYVCEALGCGDITERKAKFCKFHATPELREEVEAEFHQLHASHSSEAPARA